MFWLQLSLMMLFLGLQGLCVQGGQQQRQQSSSKSSSDNNSNNNQEQERRQQQQQQQQPTTTTTNSGIAADPAGLHHIGISSIRLFPNADFVFVTDCLFGFLFATVILCCCLLLLLLHLFVCLLFCFFSFFLSSFLSLSICRFACLFVGGVHVSVGVGNVLLVLVSVLLPTNVPPASSVDHSRANDTATVFLLALSLLQLLLMLLLLRLLLMLQSSLS